MLPTLTLPALKASAKDFSLLLGQEVITDLYGTTDGKAIGTYVEQKFRRYLEDLYIFQPGNSANGIDFPELQVDVKATSIVQPQSSCPFKNATQKIYGLGYHLVIFVYDKQDDHSLEAAKLNILHVIFVDQGNTGDWQTTRGIIDILDRQGNKDDIVAFLEERNLPLDDIGRSALADFILTNRPSVGYLTISNALQWRLQYGRVISLAGTTAGVENLRV